ncbi:zona pellucida sperm-binding protein 3 isoform X2 [Poecilia reticulata]|uniref:zona pellucida sperm-binding protein 3 isoform X2 n=1 Tax=Poecilia reticulata TaxID=8081 RepID=UPI0007EA0A4F|nr:PREDICTED: POM121 and ZP3 fusion protein isoform X2 [Poecilia reticulata]
MFHFNQTSPEQMFISCHLRATLKQKSPHRHNKACFFHKPTFRWRSIEGDIALCECCNTDCSGLTGVKNHGHPETDETFEAHRTAGRLHVVHQSNWTGELSGFQSVEKTLLQVQSLVLNEPPTIKYSPVRRLRSLMKMFCVGSLAPGCLVPVFPYTLSLAYFLFSY